MKTVLVSLHNGIGDLIITFPIVKHLQNVGYIVSYETVLDNFELLKYFFGESVTPILYKTANRTLYDFVVDLNQMYDLNYIANYIYRDEHAKCLNRQILVAFLFKNALINDLPESLSMSSYFQFSVKKTDKILMFLSSKSAENRKISDGSVKELKRLLPDENIFLFNPTYKNLYELCENIHSAKLVVTVDTGTLHIAEILSTKWITLLTNNHQDIITKYYIHGLDSIKSNVPCSPCNYHGAGCNRNKNGYFDCIDGFSPIELKNRILALV